MKALDEYILTVLFILVTEDISLFFAFFKFYLTEKNGSESVWGECQSFNPTTIHTRLISSSQPISARLGRVTLLKVFLFLRFSCQDPETCGRAALAVVTEIHKGLKTWIPQV